MITPGRVALVTGGGRGIGAAAATALAEAGCRVAVAARSEGEVKEVAAGIVARGGEAAAFRCDVTDPAQVEVLVADVQRSLGPIDVLVNNAGTAVANRIGRVTPEEWDRIMAVNARSTFLCTRAVFDDMVGRGWGRIVNVASVAGLEGRRYVTAYTAAKHAVVGFTRAAAAEAAGTGVEVSAVCPGYVDTPMTEQSIARVRERTGMSSEEALAAMLRQSGQKRIVTAAEVAKAIVDLCAARAGERNGDLVILDGKDDT